MTRKSLEYYYALALASVLFLIWFHAPISVGFGTLFPDGAQYIKAWKEILLGITFVVALYLVTKHKLWNELLTNRILQLVLAIVALHLLTVLWMFHDWSATLAGLVIDLRFLLAFSLTFVAVKLYPQARQLFIVATATGGMLAIGFGLLQLTVLPNDVLSSIGYSKETITAYTTIDKNPDFIRIQSTLRGPNPLGAMSAVLFAGILAYAITKWNQLTRNHRLLALLAAGATALVLYSTYSRSAYLAALVAVGIIGISLYYKKLSPKLAVAGCVGGIIAAIGLLSLQQTDWYKNVVLHEDPESSEVIKSNDQHAESLETGWQRLVAQPFGAGVGSTGSASIVSDQTPNVTIENYYLFVGHEVGWLGFVGFIGLVGATLYQLQRKSSKDWAALALFSSGVGLSIAALFLPIWADDTTAIIWWGLAGAIIASNYQSNRTKP